MTGFPKPPPSLAGDEPENIKPDAALPNVQIVFADPFSPSHAEVQTSDTELANNPVIRLLSYNEHVLTTLEAVPHRAASLGLPYVFNGFPLAFANVSEHQFAVALQAIARLLPELEEGSTDWLCVKCYAHWVQACHMATDGASPGLIAQEMLLAGATAREIDLAVLNKKDALGGRKQRNTLAEHRSSAHSKQRERVEARRAAIAEMLPETKREDRLRERLLKEYDIDASLRTIRRDLKDIREQQK